MKAGLTLRAAASHLFMVVFALGLFVVVVSGVTRQELTSAGTAFDRIAARRLAPLLEQYYLQSESWRGIESVLNRVAQPAMPMPMNTPGHPGSPMRPHRGGEQTPWPGQAIALVTPQGRLIATAGVPPAAARQGAIEEPGSGIPVGPVDEPMAYIFVGTMLRGSPNFVRSSIMRSLGRAMAITAALVLVGTAMVSLLWSRWLVRPIRAVAAASDRISAGETHQPLPVPRGNHELRTLAEGFNRMAREIAAQEASRRRFVADAAHELRTPVSLISTRIQMLKDGVYSVDETQWTALEQGLDRIAHLVADLQTLARLDAGRTSMSRVALDVRRLVEDTVRQFAPTAARRRISIDLDGNLEVQADPTRLGQILSNLLSNALRYSPAGSSVRIEFGVTIEEAAYLAVEDQGPGIPENDRSRVFERFVRLDRGRDRPTGGTGLGLAIAAELAALHSGTLVVEDPRHSSSGARFVLYLPRSGYS